MTTMHKQDATDTGREGRFARTRTAEARPSAGSAAEASHLELVQAAVRRRAYEVDADRVAAALVRRLVDGRSLGCTPVAAH